MIPKHLHAPVLVLTTLAAALPAQRDPVVVHESLADRNVWTEPSAAPAWSYGTTAACSVFRKVDRLHSDTTIEYRRAPITLPPGRYRATFRHQKLRRTGLQPLALSATFGGRTVTATTTLRAEHLNEWRESAPLELLVTRPSGVVFRLRNDDATTTEADWLFDAFRLEQIAMSGVPADSFGTAMAAAGDVNADGVPDMVVGAARSDARGVDAGHVRVVSGQDLTTLYRFFGQSAGDQFGASVDGVGDVDGDGHADLVVGAPYDDDSGRDAGTAFVFSGRTGAVLHKFLGPHFHANFGSCVRGAGDVNADGHADVLVSSPSIAGVDFGRVFIYSGSDGKLLHTFVGDAKLDWFGWSADGAGDLDLDGHDDVIVGAPRDDNQGLESGAVRVFSGRTGTVLFALDGAAANHQLGFDVAGIGDANADRHPDLLVRSSAKPGGQLSCLSGKDYSVLWEFSGAGSLRAVAPAGDVNADRHDDVIVGFSHGEVRVISGRDAGTVLTETPSDTTTGFGFAVAGVGDRDGDGFGEVLVGMPSARIAGRHSGGARLLSYRSIRRPAVGRIVNQYQGGRFGASVSRVGDLDGDGRPDILVGEPKRSGVGAVWTISGRTRRTLYVRHGSGRGDEFGTSVAGIGDIDGDGVADFVVGIPFDDDNGSSSGSAVVYSGKSGNILFKVRGDRADDQLGLAVARAGDVDADGVPDILVRAQTYARVISGRSRAALWSVSTTKVSYYGIATLAGGFDLDADGHADYAVAQPATSTVAGWVRVYSGKDQAILRTFTDTTRTRYGVAVASNLDVDADGVVDFIVGAYQEALVHSGKDGSLIHGFSTRHYGLRAVGVRDVDGDGHDEILINTSTVFRSELRCGRTGRVLSSHQENRGSYGYAMAGLGDLDCDGRGDYAVGAKGSSPLEGGFVFVFSGARLRTAPRESHYGAPCADAAGRLPRMRLVGLPAIGTTSDFELRSAPAGAAGFLAVGPRANLAIGRCTALVRPLLLVPHTATAGVSRIVSPTPNSAALVGVRLAAQWALGDPANAGQLITSDAVEMVLGRDR